MCILKNVYSILIILLVTVLSVPSAMGQDDVHFGTIFVEDMDYEQSEESQSINHLTDNSNKQGELEKLYKKDIGKPNQKLKNLDSIPRRSVSSSKDKASQISVLRNSELQKKISYFLELRSFHGNKSLSVHTQATQSSPTLLKLQPGEMVRVTDTPAQYIHKMRMDRDNQGIWKKLTVREQDKQNLNIYYDWRNFETITSHDFPIELDILVPYGKNSIPVFSKPGSWTWKDCGLSEKLCLDKIDLHAKAYLFDSSVVDIANVVSGVKRKQLFYKIGYQVKDKNGETQHRVGWIPSHQAKRKISQLPKSLLATRSPSSLGGSYESDEERLRRLKKYYIFGGNLDSENKNLNRWLASAPGQSNEVFYQNFAIDGLASVQSFHLEQSFIDEEFDQIGAAVGVGMYVPIFIDLELQGNVMATIPLSANENNEFEKAYLLRSEGWLLYTTPLSLGKLPVKMGIGGYYMTMFASEKSFGFNSLVGFQIKALVEDDAFWAGFRYGPTGQDLAFRFENREVGLDIGYRFNPSKKYESWSVYGDFNDTAYRSTTSDNETKFRIMQIGVRKQF